MTYDGSTSSALGILHFVGVDTVKSFNKMDDGSLVIWRRFSVDDSNYGRYYISAGDSVYVTPTGMLRIIESE